jgi:nucleotide-binding universal stress UspA family protein
MMQAEDFVSRKRPSPGFVEAPAVYGPAASRTGDRTEGLARASRGNITLDGEVDAMSVKRILFGTDFSAASEPAFREALEMAKSARSPLLIAHVLEPPVPFAAAEGYVLPQTYDELAAVMRATAEKKMRALLERARESDVKATALLLRGAPHEAIARAARAHGIAHVVVGTHGRRGFSRLFLGSVAARLIPVAPCSVTVVPSKRSTRRRS